MTNESEIFKQAEAAEARIAELEEMLAYETAEKLRILSEAQTDRETLAGLRWENGPEPITTASGWAEPATHRLVGPWIASSR